MIGNRPTDCWRTVGGFDDRYIYECGGVALLGTHGTTAQQRCGRSTWIALWLLNLTVATAPRRHSTGSPSLPQTPLVTTVAFTGTAVTHKGQQTRTWSSWTAETALTSQVGVAKGVQDAIPCTHDLGSGRLCSGNWCLLGIRYGPCTPQGPW